MYTKQELKDKMVSLNVKKVELGERSKMDYCGYICFNKNGELEYNHKYSSHYYPKDEFAYDKAMYILLENEKSIITCRENMNKVFSTQVKYIDYDNEKYNHIEDMSKYTWNSDIKDAGVSIKDNCVVGTIDELRKFSSLSNNHWRYCRAAYRYENEQVVELMSIASKFDLYMPYDSFTEYYHNGIVD